MTMTKPETVLDAFKGYEARLLELGKPAEVKNMQTALLRFTVPGWGGYTPKNLKRSTKQDVEEGLNFLKLLPIAKLSEGDAAQERVFSQTDVTAKQRTNAKYYLNKLIALAESEGWLREKESVEAPPPARLNLVGGKKVPQRLRLTDKEKKPNYTLCSQKDDFINPRLENQINEFHKWYVTTKDLSEVAFNTNLGYLKQFFGWLIRYERASEWQTTQEEKQTLQEKQTLEEKEKTLQEQEKAKAARFKEVLDSFCLETLIPFDPLLKRTNFPHLTTQEYRDAEDDFKVIRRERANDAKKLFERFLDFYSKNHATRGFLTNMAISVTQYLYRDAIDEIDPVTIPPILLHLKVLVKAEKGKEQNSPRAVPIEKKFVSYKEALQVVVELKKRADQKERVRGRTRNKTKMYFEPRSPQEVARACSRFLMIAFLSLLPPDRQQLVRELEIGISFVRGCFGAGNVFIPEDKMSDPSQANWCFNLTKYKTHKTYGDVKITVPNYPFGGGTTLYTYIDLWLNQYRSLLNPEGDWLFVRHNKGDKWEGNDVWSMVVTVFHRQTGKSVNPHMLRHIFNTYLEETNAPKDVKSASRKLMKQSDKIGSTKYNHAITDRVVAPAIEFMRGMVAEAFDTKGVICDEAKIPVNLSLTPTAIHLLEELSVRHECSRNEVIERLVRALPWDS